MDRVQAAAEVANAVVDAEAELQVRAAGITALEAEHAQASQLCADTQARLDDLQEEHDAVLKELEAANLSIDDMQHKLQDVAGEKVFSLCCVLTLLAGYFFVGVLLPRELLVAAGVTAVEFCCAVPP